MILVDTSIWINHFKKTNSELNHLLQQNHVLLHPFVIGELACGLLPQRSKTLSDLSYLPKSILAQHQEVLFFLEEHSFYAQGIGFIDIHLLTSASLSQAYLWTLDKNLSKLAKKLQISY
ncbi:MAG: type II toxin-antitoxin system VapC family toxin [Bacteriovoracaceae bacterium]|nr:type II toxin-antitoxin system VapC family toxin [Bacteriovoracaceae bacterium]